MACFADVSARDDHIVLFLSGYCRHAARERDYEKSAGDGIFDFIAEYRLSDRALCQRSGGGIDRCSRGVFGNCLYCQLYDDVCTAVLQARTETVGRSRIDGL